MLSRLEGARTGSAGTSLNTIKIRFREEISKINSVCYYFKKNLGTRIVQRWASFSIEKSQVQYIEN